MSRLERAIRGKGAFRRFKDELREEYTDLLPVWYEFRDTRAMRRAVEWLAEQSLIDDAAAERYLASHPGPDLPGHDLTMVVYIDHNLGTVVKDGFPAPAEGTRAAAGIHPVLSRRARHRSVADAGDAGRHRSSRAGLPAGNPFTATAGTASAAHRDGLHWRTGSPGHGSAASAG